MRLVVDTVLNAPMAQVWRAMQTPRVLSYICAPLLVFRPFQP
jgi:hypothetical protein